METSDDYNIFNPHKITKYFNNQSSSEEFNFVDKYFPPNKSSLQSVNDNISEILNKQLNHLSINEDEIEWIRSSFLFDCKPFVFDNSIECDDIKQGKIGNCYFLSALVALTKTPKYIYQIFRTKEFSDNGYYEIILFIEGEWQIIILDDFIPVHKGTKCPVFAKPNQNELWVILLEKAWAKVNGGYSNTISGNSVEVLTAITGFSNECFYTPYYSNDEIFEKIRQSIEFGNFLTASTNDISDSSIGLASNHSYSILNMQNVYKENESYILLKLRNPWGVSKWKGDWSDISNLWDKYTKLQVNHNFDEDDGSFYISFDDFKKHFNWVTICYSMFSSYVKFFKILETNHPNVINIYFNDDTILDVGIHSRNWRYNRDKSKDLVTNPISLIVCRYDTYYMETSEYSGKFSCNSDPFLRVRVIKGHYLIWIYLSKEYNKEIDSYYVKVSSKEKFSFKHIPEVDENYLFLKKMISDRIRSNNKYQDTESGFYFTDEFYFFNSGITYNAIVNKNKFPIRARISKNIINNARPLGQSLGNFVVKDNTELISIAMIIKQDFHQYKLYMSPSQYNEEEIIEDEIIEDTVDINKFLTKLILPSNYSNNEFDYITQDERKLDLDISSSRNIRELRKGEYTYYINLLNELNDCGKYFLITLEDGIYVGEVNKDKFMDGYGVFRDKNDYSYFIGKWKDGFKLEGKFFNKINEYLKDYSFLSKNGFGVEYYENSEKYIGNFELGLKSGKGIYYFTDGSKWNGHFIDNIKHGVGIFYPVEGNSYERYYAEDEPFEA